MSAKDGTVLLPSDEHSVARCGGKAYALWRLREEGLPIPDWFVVTPEAFSHGALSEAARSEIIRSLGELDFERVALAVRSSSVEEDGAKSSFAGQFESFLGVAPEELEEYIRRVWESAKSDRVLAYKEARGEEEGFRPPAVLVQRMVDAKVAGVAFSVDPVTANWNNALVSSVVGLGSTLVDGESDADSYTIDRNGVEVDRSIAKKSIARRLVLSPRFAVEEMALEELEASETSLETVQVIQVADLARQCEMVFGRPQDIEWAFEKEGLYLLQSRPITTLQNIADTDGKLFIWDNSNIAESYSGITLPLTFSFARYIYTEVYRQFCLLLKVPPKRVKQHRALFGQMLGLVRGRVYYNLLSWYKVLALLPGYRLNRNFMETMMGVKESLSADAQKEVDTVRGSGKLVDALNLGVTVCGLLWKHFRMEGDVKHFYSRLDRSLGTLPKPIEQLRLDELTDHFHDLERDLLTSWDAPLVNDFIAMIFFGVLKGLCAKWIGEGDVSLQNDLICEMGNIVSAEPARRMRKMATIAALDEPLVEILRTGSIGAIRIAIAGNKEFGEEFDSYLAKFGDRCLDELKLESHALVDNPMPLYRSIGELAAHQSKEAEKGASGFSKGDTRQADAEALAFASLKNSFVRRTLFRYVLKHARRRVSGRENLRFERTRLFGRIRRIFLEIGKRLFAFNVINEPRDIFYLEIYEIIGYIEGSGPTCDLRSLIALRKQEFNAYAKEEAPDDRFETCGAVSVGNQYRSEKPCPQEVDLSGGLSGIGCCPGIVRGIARVVRDPQAALLKHGEILVAKQTDPGWIMLFPLASGLIVERGSLLSHSAIVSRELSLPSVVSVTGLMDTIRTGDELELDGSKGTISILKKVADADEDS